MSMMRVPPTSEDRILQGATGNDPNIRSKDNTTVIPTNRSSFGSTQRHILSRRSSTNARVPSVPNLLNISAGTTAMSSVPQDIPSNYEAISKDIMPIKRSIDFGIEASREVEHDNGQEGRKILTPPASSTKTQFKSPRWKNSDEDLGISPTSATGCSMINPTRRRQSSMESLMRAAATVENDSEINKLYQAKLTSIIELKNRISEEIRDWPVVTDLTNESTQNNNTSLHPEVGGGQELFMLSHISFENLNSLSKVIDKLRTNVKELIELKNQTRYMEESVASESQQDSTVDASKRRVTLPPIESLTMSIPNEQAAFRNYRFPSTSTAPSSADSHFNSSATSQTPQFQFQPQQERAQHNVISSWPVTSAGGNHHMTLSEPSGFPNVFVQGAGFQKNVQPLSQNEAIPIVFKSPHSTSAPNTEGVIGKSTTTSKTLKQQKKRKKSLNEIPSQDYRRSLTHGLILAETIRKNEQSTTSCVHCREGSTPEWRRGPYGNRTLCNACGLFYRKLIKKFGIKEANVLMRYKREENPEDRRVPSALSVPSSFVSRLDNDSNLDHDYNTIGGLNANYSTN